MRIGRLTNTINNEFKIQKVFADWLINSKKYQAFSAEVHVSAVGRRADFLIIKDGRLINVEAKCNDFMCMLSQLKDHSNYVDYSFALIPDYSFTPKWFKKDLGNTGYGLMIYNHDTETVTEVFEAHFNRPQMKVLRKNTIRKILEVQTKLEL